MCIIHTNAYNSNTFTFTYTYSHVAEFATYDIFQMYLKIKSQNITLVHQFHQATVTKMKIH